MMDTWFETEVSISFKFVQPHSGIVWEQIFKADDVLFYVGVLNFESHATTRASIPKGKRNEALYFTQVAGLH